MVQERLATKITKDTKEISFGRGYFSTTAWGGHPARLLFICSLVVAGWMPAPRV
jgi:hypothetical protein